MPRPHHPHRLATLAAALAVALACAVGLPGPVGAAAADPTAPSTPSTPTAPPPDTITTITGDAAGGFDITFYDGTSLHPPTDSEARAECSEYDTRLARVRCRTEVLTWYRDLAATQQALAWAGYQLGHGPAWVGLWHDAVPWTGRGTATSPSTGCGREGGSR